MFNGLNLFAYCCNNPVNNLDEDGNIPNWLKWLLGGLIIVASAVLTVVSAGGFAAAGAALASVFAGTASGLSGFFASVTVGALIGSTIGGIGSGITSYLSTGNFWAGAADGFMWGSISGALSGGFSSFHFSTGNFGPKDFGNMYQVIGQGFIGLSTYIARTLTNKEPLSIIGLGMSLFGGLSGGLMYNAKMPEQIFITGGNELTNFLFYYLKKVLKLPYKSILINVN